MIGDTEVDAVPVQITSDGNYLPRSISILLYGNEDHHVEIRMRLLLEGVKNSKEYLDQKFLEKGIPESQSILAEWYTMFSATYTPRVTMTPQESMKLRC